MARPKALRSSLFSPLSCLLLPWALRISLAQRPRGSLRSRAIPIPPRICWPRSALDIIVASFKRERVNAGATVTQSNIQPQRWGGDASIPNLIRRSARDDNNIAAPGVPSLASNISSSAASANGRTISLARWNSHYLIPPVSATGNDSTPVGSFTSPDWVLVTAQGPNSAPLPNAVIGRYAFAVYDEGGLIDVNLGGAPNYAFLTPPTRPARRLAPKYPVEESEIMLAACQPPSFTPDHLNHYQKYNRRSHMVLYA